MIETDPSSFLYGQNSRFIEDLYARYSRDPNAVDESWRSYFRSLEEGNAAALTDHHNGPSWARSDWPVVMDEEGAPEIVSERPAAAPADVGDVRAATLDSIRALMLIRAYRVRGHLAANLDPLGLEKPVQHPELDPETYGFGPEDMDRPIFIDNVLGLETATIRQIMDLLKRTYASNIGIEFMHISVPEEKAWLQARIEGLEKEISFTREGKLAIFQKLVEAEGFEKFLNRKYTGTKRFGLDGAEALIPGMEQIIKRGGHLGVKEIVIGMPHRGRLNVLANVLKKPFKAIFHEFQGGSANPDDVGGSGDVKYHLGTSADRVFDGNEVHLSLTSNPSHLEAVDPVVLGKARAKQSQREDRERKEVLSVLLHGDAAFSGQGLVAECFGLSQLRGYRTGGTIHIIVNNQIGFTTSPNFSRSSPYPSDMAKMVQAPIFHVNGDDPEAVVHCCKVATEFRQEFGKDVVIDMFCYRRYGHNESDEPAFTQPLMYKAISGHPTTREIYARKLVEEGLLNDKEAEAHTTDFNTMLEEEFEQKNYRPNAADWLQGRWAGFEVAGGDVRRGQTAVSMNQLKKIGKILTTIPDGFEMHRTLRRLIGNKEKMLESGQDIDWATAEALAFGTLVDEGYRVRLSGQDSGRGTFSQRHAVWVDQNTEKRYVPLKQVGVPDYFEVHDSMLSEAAVLGFEYGYTLAEPNALVIWEAQFGDFANGAQVIIDQFISSAEAKWLRMSGLVMFLPHGYEGQGPEHSSARLERYLQLCAEDNIQVANVTTPANLFHILRRQMHRKFRKPLILMTPKSLLRHKLAVSRLDEMGPGSSFHRLLWDRAESDPTDDFKLKSDNQITRVIFCTGKVYYDLFEERKARGLTNTYIYRIEQLYPFPYRVVVQELQRFSKVKDVVWCQEEPRNMGAWTFVETYLEKALQKAGYSVQRPRYAGRRPAASPATGLMSRHLAEQQEFFDSALKG